jgi:aminoglycoside 3'-phosphotransferase-2
LVFPEQGMTSSVAFVEPGDWVLKRCADPIYLDWLRREGEVLVALEGTGLPVPRVLDRLDRGDEVWLVMTRLRGASCSTVLRGSDRAGRRALAGRLGAFLRRLHDTPVPPPLARSGDWARRKLEEAERNLAWCDGSADLLRRLVASAPEPVRPTLIHGDLNLDNVLTDRGEVTGLVDWAAGDHGDPRCDVALALQPDEALTFDADELAVFLAAYGAHVPHDARRWFEDLYEFF